MSVVAGLIILPPRQKWYRYSLHSFNENPYLILQRGCEHISLLCTNQVRKLHPVLYRLSLSGVTRCRKTSRFQPNLPHISQGISRLTMKCCYWRLLTRWPGVLSRYGEWNRTVVHLRVWIWSKVSGDKIVKYRSRHCLILSLIPWVRI